MKYPSDWVTTGFSRVDGKWVELGHSLSVTVDPPAIKPEIPIHEVADFLNAFALAQPRKSRQAFRSFPPYHFFDK